MTAHLTRIATATATATVLAFAASGVFAHDVSYEGDMYHRLAHQVEGQSRPSTREQAPLGYQLATPAERLVILDGSVRHLNVTQQESVTFQVGSQRFTWNFDTLGTPTFNLVEIAPKGISVGQVEVHVSPNPLYIGG